MRWQEGHPELEPGSIQVPEERTITWQDGSELTEQVISYWAHRELLNWQEKSKVTVSRIIAAKLKSKTDVEEVNAYLLQQQPWADSGSSWIMHPNGDYDFTLTILTGILWLFGDEPETLYPETREHLLDVLLTEEGTCRRVHVPMTFGLVKETENHILMTQGSCYLKNRWLCEHGETSPKYNNVKNGMEDMVLDYLGEIESGGLYEFNSIPYLAYTMTALLNLEAFGSEKVRFLSKRILDRLNWQYAVGSLSRRRCVPFRRNIEKINSSLKANYQNILITVWMSLKPNSELEADSDIIRSSHALWPALMPYRLSDKTAEWIENKPTDYFIRIGHGPNSSPEIYSGGPGYLLTAGGVNRGPLSMIAARPITLMLDDKADRIDQVFHLAGPGEKYKKWNNTGVYKHFACAAGKVHIPKGWEPTVENDIWHIYSQNNLLIAVHSQDDLGIIVLFKNGNAEEILHRLSEVNTVPSILYEKFIWPNGDYITYDLKAKGNRWVIRTFNSKRLDRNFDEWPLMSGGIE